MDILCTVNHWAAIILAVFLLHEIECDKFFSTVTTVTEVYIFI